MDLTLKERYERLVAFAHNRRESELTDTEVAERSGVDLAILHQIRDGSLAALCAHDADAITRTLGLQSGSYLGSLDSPEDFAEATTMHEKLDLYIAARELGVQHIAARDTSRSPRLVGRVRDQLRALASR